MKIVVRLGRNLTNFVHLAYWRCQRIEISQFWFQQVNRQSFLHILWKFGDISDPIVLGEIKKLYGWSHGWAIRHLGDQ